MAQINAKQDVLLAADVGGTHARVGSITTPRRPGLAMELLRYRDSRCAESPGPGLLNVYDAICRIDGLAAHLTIPAEMTYVAEDLRDVSAKEAVQVFCGISGSSVGDLVPAYGATGVFLAGSILPKILEFPSPAPFSKRCLH